MPVGVWAHKPAQAISTYLLPVQLLQLPDMGAAVNAATARPTQRRHCTAVSVTVYTYVYEDLRVQRTRFKRPRP